MSSLHGFAQCCRKTCSAKQHEMEMDMKVALIGVTGNVGSRLASELLKRGYLVTGIALHPEKAEPRRGLTLEQGDARVASGLTPLLAGRDAVVSATSFQTRIRML